MKYIAIILAVTGIIYLLGAFITLQFDITQWNADSRFIAAFSFVALFIFFCFIEEEY